MWVFDVVDHYLLLKKSSLYGFKKADVQWVKVILMIGSLQYRLIAAI